VFRRSIDVEAVPFRAVDVPTRVVQVAVPHLDVTILIGRVPVSFGPISGATEMDANLSRISHLAIADGKMARTRRIHSDLAGEAAAVPDRDMLLALHVDPRPARALGHHVKLDAIHGVVGARPENGPAAVVAEDDSSLAVRSQDDGEVGAAIGDRD